MKDDLSVVVMMVEVRDVASVDYDGDAKGGEGSSASVGGGREMVQGEKEEQEEGEEEDDSMSSSTSTCDDDECEGDYGGSDESDDDVDLSTMLRSICFHDAPPPDPISMSPQSPLLNPLMTMNSSTNRKLATVSWSDGAHAHTHTHTSTAVDCEALPRVL